MKKLFDGKIFSGGIVETQENKKGIRYLSVKTMEMSDEEYAKVSGYKHAISITFTFSLTHRKDRGTTTVRSD